MRATSGYKRNDDDACSRSERTQFKYVRFTSTTLNTYDSVQIRTVISTGNTYDTLHDTLSRTLCIIL